MGTCKDSPLEFLLRKDYKDESSTGMLFGGCKSTRCFVGLEFYWTWKLHIPDACHCDDDDDDDDTGLPCRRLAV